MRKTDHARHVEIRELLAEFGVVLYGHDPGVAFHASEDYCEMDSVTWRWLEPLLVELRDERAANRRTRERR